MILCFQVRKLCNCTVVKFPFEKYPDHVRVLKGYCWKPIIVKVISKMSFRCMGIPHVFLSIAVELQVVICGKYINLTKITKNLHMPLKFNRLLIFVILYSLQCKIEGHAV